MNLSSTNLSSLLCLYGIQFFDTIRTIFHQLYTNIILNYLKQYFRLVSISTYSWNFRTPGTRVTRDDFIDVEVGVVGRVPSIQRHFRATWAPFRPHLWIWPLCSSMFKITLHLGWTSLSLDDGGKKGRATWEDKLQRFSIFHYCHYSQSRCSLCETIAIFFS